MSGETDVQAVESAALSGITPNSIKATLTEKLQAQHVDVEDISGILNHVILLIIMALAEDKCRWLWSSIRSYHSLTAFHKEDDVGTTSSSKHGFEG